MPDCGLWAGMLAGRKLLPPLIASRASVLRDASENLWAIEQAIPMHLRLIARSAGQSRCLVWSCAATRSGTVV